MMPEELSSGRGAEAGRLDGLAKVRSREMARGLPVGGLTRKIPEKS